MDCYFLLVSKGPLTDRQRASAANHIRSLVPSSLDYRLGSSLASPLLPLLTTGSLYLACVDPAQTKDSRWTKVAGVEELLAIRDTEAVEAIEFDLISAHIHELADLLPAYGSYKLDVFVTPDVIEAASVSGAPEVASALYRLQWWHGARTTVLPDSESERGTAGRTDSVLDAGLPDEDGCGPALWRGCVELQAPEDPKKKVHCHGLELRLDRDRTAASLHSSHFEEEPLQEMPQACVCSPVLQVVDECRFASIPPYLLSPLVCRVCTSDVNAWNEGSRGLLDHVTSNDGGSLIVRMRLWERAGRSEPDRSRRTDRWRRAVASGTLSHPVPVPDSDRQVTLALTRSGDSSEVLAYVLRGPGSLSVRPFYGVLGAWQPHGGASVADDAALPRLPLVDARVFAAFIRLLRKRGGHSPQSLGAELCLSTSDLKTIPALSPISRVVNVSTDPSDWMERVLLLRRQIQSEESVPSVLKDPGLSRQCVSLSLREIRERFGPSGEARDGSPTPQVPGGGVEADLSLVQKWPDALYCTHDGVYYNSDPRAEEKECLGNRMVELYVRRGTAGTWEGEESPRRPAPFAPDPALRDFMDRGRRGLERWASEDSASGGVSQKVRGGVPLRRSPRRRSSSHSKVLPSKQKSEKTQSKSTQELPDILRKKLRAAVATALEGEGVQLEDPFFRPCGKRLFAICQAFVQDLSMKKGSMSQRMQKIAEAHVKQVIEYERQRDSGQ